MSFLWPIMLPFLVLVPLLGLLYLLVQGRKRRAAETLGSLAQLRDERGRAPGRRRHLPALILITGVTLLLCALARPQAEVNLPRRAGTLVLAFDISASMSAQDMKPNRLEAARAVALDFLSRQPESVEVGIVAFSDGGVSVQAPTTDHERISAAIGRLEPAGGTSVGQGIMAALNSIAIAEGDEALKVVGVTPDPARIAEAPGSQRSAMIVLLTDGENQDAPDPLVVAQDAADRGVRIHAIGMGSPAGTTLQVDGFTVHTSLDEELLRKIAEITEGRYFNAQSAEDLRQVYEGIEPELRIEAEKMEITALFAVAGLAVLLIGAMLSLLWLRRMP